MYNEAVHKALARYYNEEVLLNVLEIIPDWFASREMYRRLRVKMKKRFKSHRSQKLQVKEEVITVA